jgi:hypothetical protein
MILNKYLIGPSSQQWNRKFAQSFGSTTKIAQPIDSKGRMPGEPSTFGWLVKAYKELGI